jgi:hypothetical protein
MLFLGCFAVGLAQGIGQFFRFSAIEVSPPDYKSKAVTIVLSGGIIAAGLGPGLAIISKKLLTPDYLLSYVIMGVLGVVNFCTLQFVNFPPQDDANKGGYEKVEMGIAKPIRSWMEICAQPLFIISCMIATMAHTVMVMVMSNNSLAMRSYGYSYSVTSACMGCHFLAMFSPGFFTGKLINKQGPFRVSLAGSLIFGVAAVFLDIGDNLYNFFLGMILLGVAWNFAFSSGTVMLTDCYSKEEATEVQAINDFILFSIAGAGSLVSGFIFKIYGWHNLIYGVSGVMAVNVALIFTAKTLQEVNTDAFSRSRIASRASKNPSFDQDRYDYEEVAIRVSISH